MEEEREKTGYFAQNVKFKIRSWGAGSPDIRLIERFFWRRVWEAAPYEKNQDFPFYSVTLKKWRLFWRFENPGDSHASVRYFSE